jgi:hypothetical protein
MISHISVGNITLREVGKIVNLEKRVLARSVLQEVVGGGRETATAPAPLFFLLSSFKTVRRIFSPFHLRIKVKIDICLTE